ncbi:hypothetical protein PR048_003202 [Dryococelus australis]|uniref:Uncharacterized protein n=1 Tax=Dryococelus australis TaxID=614101 RepID=A0ABQ9INR6_9NEOP|nr:hypothetical protein PR048_003202 [Dryococelus australis]
MFKNTDPTVLIGLSPSPSPAGNTFVPCRGPTKLGDKYTNLLTEVPSEVAQSLTNSHPGKHGFDSQSSRDSRNHCSTVRADLPWHSRLARHRPPVREALGSSLGQGVGAAPRKMRERAMRFLRSYEQTSKTVRWRRRLSRRGNAPAEQAPPSKPAAPGNNGYYRAPLPGTTSAVARTAPPPSPIIATDSRRDPRRSTATPDRTRLRARLGTPGGGRGRGDLVVRLLTSRLGEPSLIPGGLATGISHVGIMADDAAGRRIFSGISRFSHLLVPPLLHTRAAQTRRNELKIAVPPPLPREMLHSPHSTSLFADVENFLSSGGRPGWPRISVVLLLLPKVAQIGCRGLGGGQFDGTTILSRFGPSQVFQGGDAALRRRDLLDILCHWLHTRIDYPAVNFVVRPTIVHVASTSAVLDLDKIDVKHVYTEIDFGIGSQFIRHALDDSEPTAGLQGNNKYADSIPVRNCYKLARVYSRSQRNYCTAITWNALGGILEIMPSLMQCILNGSYAACAARWLRLVSDELGNLRLDSAGARKSSTRVCRTYPKVLGGYVH